MSSYALSTSGKNTTSRSPRRGATSPCIQAPPDAAYAQFLIGSSYFDQIPDITRDQARTEKAMAALDEVIRKYPNTEYAVSAKKKLEVARDQLAGTRDDGRPLLSSKQGLHGARSTASRPW